MALALPAATSSSSRRTCQEKYDVFLSFRGEDTRNNFTSHLYAALTRRKVLTFIDDNLTRGEEISSSLVETIEQSQISVVVFSENYASSKWCLAELAKIMECKKLKEQMVIPIFYRVDPSHVRHQRGSFANAFAEHERRLKDERGKLQQWRLALTEAANLSGWDSMVTRPESKLIEEVANVIMKKLYSLPSTSSGGLVGIGSRIEQVKTLLCMESPDVRILGIWGMAGIGKTTIARAIYNQISIQFEGGHFLADVREELKRNTITQLRKMLLSKILEDQDQDASGLNFGNTFTRRRLHCKRILIVLDDVDDSIQLQELLSGEHNLFGPGSRILVTSRDKQVLKSVVDEIYKVEGLNHEQSLQLFMSCAFKKQHPTSGLMVLSQKVLNYAQGNPLALKVLGSALLDRGIEDWESALRKLKNVPNPKIQDLLRVSYDGLDDEERKIFLDIACFFKGYDKNHVMGILYGRFCSVHFSISTLVDKCLITISNNKLEMHDLLQEMGWAIVCEESTKLGKRSRLWDPIDVYHVLTKKKKKRTESIEGIFCDMSKAKEMRLKFDAFKTMHHLRLLKFYASNSTLGYKVQLPHGLRSLPDALNYLHWYRYPLRSLPSKFCPENLVVLELPDSKVEQLWTGVQILARLKEINLMLCKRLATLPDLSRAKNLEKINLLGCNNLVMLHSSIQDLDKLKYLDLSGCKNLSRLPDKLGSKFLEEVHLSWCSKVKKCPDISGNLEKLDLGWTAVKQLPQSICQLTFLRNLTLAGAYITTFPELPRNIKWLSMSGTMIKEIPSSIEFLQRLETMLMSENKKLNSLPSNICKLKRLHALDFSGCSKLENFPEILEPMEGLLTLDLSRTAIKELPSSIKHLYILKELYLSGCKGLKSVPLSVNELSCLEIIDISDCHNLPCLPELPISLLELIANNCEIIGNYRHY